MGTLVDHGLFSSCPCNQIGCCTAMVVFFPLAYPAKAWSHISICMHRNTCW